MSWLQVVSWREAAITNFTAAEDEQRGSAVALLAPHLLAVGARNAAGGRGVVYLLHLSSTGETEATKVLGTELNLPAGAWFGCSLAAVPLPATQTGYMLAVGAIGEDESAGAAYLLRLDTTGALQSHTRIAATGPLQVSPGEYFGHALAALPDTDGDGEAVLCISALTEFTAVMIRPLRRSPRPVVTRDTPEASLRRPFLNR